MVISVVFTAPLRFDAAGFFLGLRFTTEECGLGPRFLGQKNHVPARLFAAVRMLIPKQELSHDVWHAVLVARIRNVL